MLQRIIGVFKLDVNTFEEIEHDSSATTQAAIIVAIVALLSAVGAGFAANLANSNFAGGFLGTLVWTFVGWFLWALISWLVGTKLFGGQASIDEMLRVIGFAYAPQVLAVIPCIGGIAGGIWSLIAGFIAVRQGLDLDNMKALLTILVGFLVYIAGSLVINTLVVSVGHLLG